MMIRGSYRLAAFLLSGLLVNACDSGPLTAGIDRSGNRVVSKGPITGFGSIFVNDVRYELSGAQIDVNGEPATEADLALGQIVTVTGTIDAVGVSGTADTIVFQANVQGPVDSVDAGAGTLMVLGQDIRIDAGTVFDLGADPGVLASISVGDPLQVSGFVGAGGMLNATRVERQAAQNELLVIGTAMNVDLPGTQFTMNGLVIDYGNARMINGFPGGQPGNGDEVLVKGVMLGAGGELLADELELIQEGLQGDEAEEAEVEGLITLFVSPADFEVSGLPVTTTAATAYEGGTEASLMLNVKIQVEGTINASGVIVAEKIEVKDGGRVAGN